jgi:hypothetical protein
VPVNLFTLLQVIMASNNFFPGLFDADACLSRHVLCHVLPLQLMLPAGTKLRSLMSVGQAAAAAAVI